MRNLSCLALAFALLFAGPTFAQIGPAPGGGGGGVTGSGTTGNCAQWTSSGAIGAASSPCGSGGTGRLLKLGTLIGANFDIATDQAITITGTSSYVIDKFVVTNCSVSMTAAQGTFYPGASRSGVAFFGQSGSSPFTRLSSATVAMIIEPSGNASSSSAQTIHYTAGTTIYFNLTTIQGSAGTCDLYVYGTDLS